VHPILGAAVDGTVLLVRDRAGYAQLCRLLTAYHLDGEFDLAAHTDHDGLFVLSADQDLLERLCAQGRRPLAAITHWGDARSRYQAGALREWARTRGLRPVAVNPVYFLGPGDERLHRVLTAIRLNTTADSLTRRDVAPPGAWFRNPAEMTRLYEDWPETLENLEWVAEQCQLELRFGTPLFPEPALPPGETAFSYLWKRAFDGVKARYRPLRPEVTARLHYELDVIHDLGFAPYFLILVDIVDYARGRDIPIMGRGSAANSLVAYALGITRVEPFKYDLYFRALSEPFPHGLPGHRPGYLLAAAG
jgi:DNA polymerase III alpha subunit